MSASIYEAVTRSIIAELEHGAVPWVKPWKTVVTASPRSAVSQRTYRGVNVLLLWAAAIEKGYTNPAWLTYRQTRELSGIVRRGEHGTRIVYTATRKNVDEAKEDQAPKPTRSLKWYYVFNVEQTEGLPQHLYERVPAKPLAQALEHVETFIAQIGADVRHGGEVNRPGIPGDSIS